MNGFHKRLLCGVICLLFLLPLSSCAKKPAELTFSDGAYRNEKKGFAMVFSPSGNYRAKEILNEKAVAVIPNKSGDIHLYEIPGLDPKLWLADEEYYIYHGASQPLPTLADMTVERISIASAEQQYRKNELSRLTDAEEIAELIDLLFTTEPISESRLADEIGNRFELFFFSREYPNLLYVMDYWSYEIAEGGVVYDGTNGNCYEIGSTLEALFLSRSGED